MFVLLTALQSAQIQMVRIQKRMMLLLTRTLPTSGEAGSQPERCRQREVSHRCLQHRQKQI